jgi:hypothetical protein
MGLFNVFGGIQGKASKIERLLNTANIRMGEFIAASDKHPNLSLDTSACVMFSELFDEIYKLYTPNKLELDRYGMTMDGHKFNNNLSSKDSIAFFVATQFKVILAFEEDFKVTIFKDYMQREFAKSIMPFDSNFINGLQ